MGNKERLAPRIVFYTEERFKRRIIILSLIFCIALSAYLYTAPVLGNFFFYIYYLPILLGVVYYGLRGGVIVSITASILYTFVLVSMENKIGVLWQWNILLRIGFFNIVALALGRLADVNSRTREEIFYLEEFNEDVVESITEGIVVTDRDGRITGVNKELATQAGLNKDEIVGKYFKDIFPPIKDFNWQETLSFILKTGRFSGASGLRYGPPLMAKDVIINIKSQPLKDKRGQIIGTVTLVDYITEKEKLKEGLRKAYRELRATQEQLIQSGKMAAVGKLAGGVAHNINNPLMGVLGFTQAMLFETDQKDPQYQDLKQIETATLHCKEVVQGLLNFSRLAKVEFAIVDVNKAIEDTLSLASYQIKKSNTKVNLQLDPELLPVSGVFNQLQQVFLNMITNGIDAVAGEGELTIKSRNLDQESVEVTFSDPGCGIPPQILDKIFEPFFSTKEPGKGTGLGLSVTYGIVKDHGGDIDVESKEGEGTTFKVTLPAKKIKKV